MQVRDTIAAVREKIRSFHPDETDIIPLIDNFDRRVTGNVDSALPIGALNPLLSPKWAVKVAYKYDVCCTLQHGLGN